MCLRGVFAWWTGLNRIYKMLGWTRWEVEDDGMCDFEWGRGVGGVLSEQDL